jgi:hypothetical protein
MRERTEWDRQHGPCAAEAQLDEGRVDEGRGHGPAIGKRYGSRHAGAARRRHAMLVPDRAEWLSEIPRLGVAT